MKRIFSLLFAAMLVVQAWAQTTFEVGNLEYTVTDETNHYVSVGKISEDNTPTGDLVIPTEVENGGTTYSVTSIMDSAFAMCVNLTSVSIPYSIQFINKYAFYGCSSLTAVNIPDSVLYIGYAAFENCNNLAKATFGSIESMCNISYLSASSNPLYYAHHLYIDGEEVTDIVIPDNITNICWSAFIGCSSLTSVTIPKSVIKIQPFSFSSCSNLTNVYLDDNNENYTLEDGVLFNKDKTQLICSLTKKAGNYIIPNSVTSINEGAFYNCGGLTSVTIPNSVSSIGRFAFSLCTGITSITIPESVTDISESAFSYCYELTTVNIPESVTTIEESVFKACTYLTSISIPNSITSIGKQAFSYCYRLTSVTIPKSVENIDDEAFNNCYDLNHIVCYGALTYNSELPTIGDKVFDNRNCTITVPCGQTQNYKDSDWGQYTNLTYNEDYLYEFTAEANNHELGSVEILQLPDCSTPAKVKATANEGYVFVMWDDKRTNEEITVDVSGDRFCTAYFAPADADINIIPKNDAFWYYNSDTKTLHVAGLDELTIYGDYMWGDLPKTEVEHVFIEDGFTYIDASTFQNFTALKDVRLPATLKKVGSYAFNGCESLESVVIPEGVTEIEYAAFNGCSSMKYAVLPTTLQRLWTYAFSSCTLLDSIVVKNSTVIEIPSMVFGGSVNKKFYIPCGKKTAYINSDWEIYVTSENNFVETMVYDLSVATSDKERGTAAITQAPNCGTNAIVTATAKKNYQFLRWSDGANANPYILSVDKDTLLTAIFVGKESTITVSADTNGVVSVPNAAHFEDTVQLTVTPKIGYKIDNLTVITADSTVTLHNNRFLMPATVVTIKASFKLIDYEITTNAKNGTIIVPETAHYGDNVTFSIKPDVGYELSSVSVKDTNDKNVQLIDDKSFVMPATDIVISAKFKQIDYQITTEAENGKILVSETSHFGDTVTFSIKPDIGYELLSFSVKDTNDKNIQLADNKFLMPATDVNIAATFKLADYKITVDIENGKITVPETAHYGDTVMYEIVVDYGYWVSQLSVEYSHSEGKQHFIMPAEDLTITAEILRISHSVRFENDEWREYLGDTVTLDIEPSSGSRIELYFRDYIWNTDVEVELVGETSFIMPDSDVEVMYSYVKNTAVTETAANAVSIYAHGRTIVVENATEEISVYDAMGRIVCRDAINRVRTEIRVNTAGLYIVKVGTVAKRVMVND